MRRLEPAPAPVSVTPVNPAQPGNTVGSQFHVVQRGETLYSIARNNNIDVTTLLSLNNMAPGQSIREGQVLRLAQYAVAGATPATASAGVQPAPGNPLTAAAPASAVIQGQPLLGPASAPSLKPLPGGPATLPAPVATPIDAPLKREPKAQRLPYSDAALAAVQRGEASATTVGPASTGGATQSDPRTAPASGTGTTAAATATSASNAGLDAEIKPGAGVERHGITWSWPTTGRIVSKFNDKAPLKGIDIVAPAGTPVVAAAAGRVIYVGKEPRGYGQLIVIEHVKGTVSVYFHTVKVQVKEQQQVLIGQKIAEISETAGNKMHFEVRRENRPQDPQSFLSR